MRCRQFATYPNLEVHLSGDGNGNCRRVQFVRYVVRDPHHPHLPIVVLPSVFVKTIQIV